VSDSISVVIPCYNEADGIGQLRETLERLEQRCRDRSERLEVLLVNDGSRDGTGAALEAAFSGREGYRILTHAVNRGVGAAMRTGFDAASGSIITCYDADCAYPIEDLLKLVDEVRAGADVASATPFVAGGGIDGVPWHRQVLSRGVAQLYRVVIGQPGSQVGTFSCAFRAYRLEALRSIRFESDGFPAASEILCRLLLEGYRVVEVPSILSDRKFGVSKMRKLETIRAHLRLIARFARLRLGG
jgi:dolichol-phosphate mannosyltransferase